MSDLEKPLFLGVGRKGRSARRDEARRFVNDPQRLIIKLHAILKGDFLLLKRVYQWPG
jgi:hypothetical protein